MDIEDLSFIKIPENVKTLMNEIKSQGYEAVVVGVYS